MYARISKKPLCFAMRSRCRRRRDNFSAVARFFLKLVPGKMGKTKKDTNARVPGRRKQIKESAAEQLYMVNCAWTIFQWVSMSPMIRQYWIHRSLCQYPCYCSQVSKFLQNLFFSLTSIFCPPYTIAIASSARRTFASSLIEVFSFVLRCFCFFELVHVFDVVYVY